MRICNGCGGVLGRDCFNGKECEWISQQQQQQYEHQAESQVHYLTGHVESLKSQIAILEAALREYSSHKLSCNTKAIEMGRIGISDFICNCGLDDALSQAGLSNDKGGV